MKSSVKPINYNLEFEPNFEKFTFTGKEVIDIESSKYTKSIELDCAELKIQRCYLIQNAKTIHAKTKIIEKTESLKITLDKKFKDSAKLCIEFSGILNDRLLGFYRSQYTDSKGKKKFLATTQFEAADARRAFPCWDEPLAKATFDVSIITPNSMIALSNMPEISKSKIGKKTLYEFERTPVMSTYLLYLGVGEFEFLKGKMRDVQVRIVTTKGNRSKAKLSLDMTKKFLSEYEKYFGIKYPLPKLDMIAVPDFAAGAMENWGAITFRETILLYDPKSSSTRTKQFIAEVISHELAHQWFGNLVTMEWWNDLWLNESFATFMATKIVDKFYPEWELWDQFLEEAMNQAMGLDSLKSSHPINVKVNHPAEIREIFDSISYDKGGCVLRMLEHFVGNENFRKGLKYYLKKHMYQNATTDDLWSALSKVSKKPVNKMMDSWIRQVGFPLVKAELKKSSIQLEQKRYLKENNTRHQKGLWSIPISLGSKNPQKKLMSQKKTNMKLVQKPILNSGKFGFYRVQYDEKLRETITSLVYRKSISPVDRWSIQNDLFSLCVSGNVNLRTYLEFTHAYHDETSYLSSVNLAHNLFSLYMIGFGKEHSAIILPFVKNYLWEIFQRLGWRPKRSEPHTDAMFRGFVISALGKLDDNEILQEANKKFNEFLRKPDSISPDLRETVFSLAAWSGDKSTWQKLEKLYKKTKSQEAKLRILAAMCNFKQESLLKKTLAFSLTDQVRSQNIHLPIMRISANPYGKKLMWSWMTKNWSRLVRKFGLGNPLANRIVSSVGSTINAKDEKKVRVFFKKNPLPGTERVLEQTMERVRVTDRLLHRMITELPEN